MARRFSCTTAAVAAGASIAALLMAGTVAPAAAQAGSTPAAAGPPSIQLSGIIVGLFRYGGTPARRSANEFDISRAYLNVRASPAPRIDLRLTTDVLRRTDTLSYRGWSIRLKYAFGQYTFLGPASGEPGRLRADARFGMLQTVVIEHQEGYWPRWVGPTALDRLGFFASSDVGAASLVRLPERLGEVYVTVTNGDGYQTGEVDRFKDVAARLSVTPFAAGGGPLRTLAVTPWIHRGARASDFSGGRGTVSPIATARARHRHGLSVGVRASRLAAGAEWAERLDEIERADTLVDVAPSVTRRSQRLTSAFAHARPFAGGPGPLAPLGMIGRVDRLETVRGGSGDARFVLAGLTWDLDSRVLLGADYQEQTDRGGTAPDVRLYSFRVAVSY